jgi:hypothetical protein
MSQQYPQQPEPVKKKRRKGCLFAVVGAAVLVVIIVAASSNGSKGTSDSDSSTSTGSHKSAAKTPEQSPLDAFRAYVAKHGTATEKAAVKHTTKIQGADSENDILDAADVYTDYSGGMMGGHANDAKLIASVFADWQQSRGKDSKNGLVTIYDKSGDLLSNGKY